MATAVQVRGSEKFKQFAQVTQLDWSSIEQGLEARFIHLPLF